MTQHEMHWFFPTRAQREAYDAFRQEEARLEKLHRTDCLGRYYPHNPPMGCDCASRPKGEDLISTK